MNKNRIGEMRGKLDYLSVLSLDKNTNIGNGNLERVIEDLADALILTNDRIDALEKRFGWYDE